MWKPIAYDYNEKGDIVLPPGPPFDGKPVLIRLAAGICEAWWAPAEEIETQEATLHEGFYWVCLDDDFKAELEDAKEWMPIPVAEIDSAILSLKEMLESYRDIKRIQETTDYMKLARSIMTLCGCAPASPSLEPGACPITDKIAAMLEGKVVQETYPPPSFSERMSAIVGDPTKSNEVAACICWPWGAVDPNCPAHKKFNIRRDQAGSQD